MLPNSKRTVSLKLVLAITIAILPQLISGFVFGVDLGTESYKVALVRPRLDVALNDASSRKTPTVVSYYQGDLLTGTDAKNLLTRAPAHVYTNIHRLLGKEYGDAEVEKDIAEGKFPYKLVEFQGGYGIYLDESITFAPEDILAFILSNAKDIAAKNAGMLIKDCVITVPSFYNQYERQAVLDAAKIAGVNVLSLLNDNTAIALNWGIERQFDSENYTSVVFYDMGATKTEATLVTFKSVTENKKNKTVGQLTVQGVAWDKTLGGNAFDSRLVDYFIKTIKEQYKVDISKDSKAMAKLFREAQKVKEVLSANTDTFANVEGLTSDIDFKVKITRDLFEELNSDLFDRAIAVISNLIKDSQIQVEDIQYFELVGGGIRIPKLQSRMKEFLKRNELDKHLNGDESAVLGATFYGASMSSAFRAKEFKIKDYYNFNNYVNLIFQDNEEKQTELFTVGSRLSSKKSVNFLASDNFTASLYYDTVSNPSRQLLGKYLVHGLPTKETYNFTGTPKVQAGFRLNSNSIVQVDKIEAEITVTTTTLVPKATTSTSTTTSDNTDSDEEETTSTDEETTSEENPSESEEVKKDEVSEEGEAQEVTEATETEKEEKEVEMEERVTSKVHRITLKTTPIQVPGMTDKGFANSKKILADINSRLEAKKEREREKNNVESYVYDTRDKLDSEEILAISTEEQREKFKEELSNAGDWLYEEGRDATTAQYREKLNSLKKEGDSFFKRASEVTLRPQAVEYADLTINSTRTFLQNITAVYEVTEEEKEDILELIDELEKWLVAKTEEQSKKAPHEPLAFTSDQVYKKCKSVEVKVKPLFYRKIRKPKVEETTSNTTTIDTEDVKIEDTDTETVEEQEQESIEQNKEEL